MTRVKRRSRLGIRLKSDRKAAGLSLRELEAKTGISNAFLSQLETGRAHSASVETVAKLAKALKCDPAWLAFGARA